MLMFGENFVVSRNALNAAIFSANSIYDVYEKPSTTKVKIYDKWFKYFYRNFNNSNTHVLSYGVVTKNTFSFTIKCYVYCDNGTRLHFYITKSNNYIYIER